MNNKLLLTVLLVVSVLAIVFLTKAGCNSSTADFEIKSKESKESVQTDGHDHADPYHIISHDLDEGEGQLLAKLQQDESSFNSWDELLASTSLKENLAGFWLRTKKASINKAKDELMTLMASSDDYAPSSEDENVLLDGARDMAFETLAELDPDNLDYQTILAARTIEKAADQNDVMKGVQGLLSVVRADSNHLLAIEKLAELSIQSGQLEKAKKRYEKLVSLQPQSEKYRRALLELCSSLGDVDCLEQYGQED